jgi:hypothetical protein
VLALHGLAFAAVLVVVETARMGTAVDALDVPAVTFDRGYEDFDYAYYPAGRLIREQPAKLYAKESYATPDRPPEETTTAGHFVNIPIIAWLFAPFTLLSKRAAGDLFLVLNLAVSVAALVVVQRRIPASVSPALRWLVTAAFASSGPLQSALHLGQTTPAVLLALVWAESCMHRGREVACGLWLGAVGLLKVPPLALLAALAWCARWRAVVAATFAIVAATIASLAVYGLGLHGGYMDSAFVHYVGTALPSHDCQSIASVVARLATDAPLWSWRPVPLPPAARLAHGIAIAVVVAIAAIALLRVRRPAPYADVLLAASLALCTALLVLPVYWVHYGVWLLPAAVAAAGAGRAGPTPGLLAAVVLAVLLVNVPIPPRSIIEGANDARWFRLLISHQAAGTLLLGAVCAWRLCFDRARS